MPTPLVELAKALSRSIRDEPISPADLKALEAFRMAAGSFVKGIGGHGRGPRGLAGAAAYAA